MVAICSGSVIGQGWRSGVVCDVADVLDLAASCGVAGRDCCVGCAARFWKAWAQPADLALGFFAGASFSSTLYMPVSVSVACGEPAGACGGRRVVRRGRGCGLACSGVAAGKGKVRSSGICCSADGLPASAAGCQRPDDMHAAGQHAEEIGVVERDANQHVVRRYAASRNWKRGVWRFRRWRCSAATR
jgi:hypothetical protein